MKQHSIKVIISLIVFSFNSSHAGHRTPAPAKKPFFPAIASASSASHSGKLNMPVEIMDDIARMVQDARKMQEQIMHLQEALAKKLNTLDAKVKELGDQSTIEF